MPLIRKSDKAIPAPAPSPADVLAALTHGDEEQRWAAARAAVAVSGGLEALAAALHVERDVRVREAIFTSLTRIGSPASLSAIVPFLRADDASLRTGALDALRALGDGIRAYLPDLLDDSDSDVRILSCELARGLPGDEATALLGALLAQEAEANVCAAAIEVLAELGGPAALSALDACAARFPSASFLTFAIKVARERILSQSTLSDV